MDGLVGTFAGWAADAWNWLTGQSSSSSPFGASDGGDGGDGSSPIFSYVLIGAVVLVVVAVIFGELEEV